ncbi:hypothetical protein BCU68_05365 [Vibrio sp. 10N.286.49.B3]|uniref:hypothetical protein n=1 Tax=Vibrio sp. 10N.286.49.B3 TaxID=1880855 RepID=UPI000C83CCDF|nr:hypothetical protein [Vibrio sp. 10N.286.49.B3]PMH41111.1 hypothetical protein BCU68_05365 [Vibrio sp. 10N.286.49.B3]
MLTKDISDELEQVLKSLQAQGKEPTLALVKARLSTPVPMPALISTIKSWKALNRVPKVEIAVSSTDNDDKLKQLEQQIAALTSRVIALESQLMEKSS